MRLPAPDVARDLAQRLHALGYTVEGVQSRLGQEASVALDRGNALPALALLDSADDSLSVVIRCLLLAEPVDAVALASACGVTLDALGDLVRRDDAGRVRASLEVAPHAVDGNWWLASDWSATRTGQELPADHVLGAGGASLMLAQCTVRPQVERALDLGVGCGVQSLSLAQHCGSVVGTDVSERALTIAAFNAALNGIDLDLRRGSLYEPVAGEQFDLIVSNPPFVIGSPDSARHDYRDAGLPGDEVCRRVVADAHQHLRPGGWCQLLANWEIHAAADWSAHPAAWLADSPLDAWVVQRDVQDLASYVETWLRDSGSSTVPAAYARQFADWQHGLRERGVVGIGFGLISLRAGRRPQPIRRFQHVPQQLAQPIGPEIEAWFGRRDWLDAGSGQPADLLLRQVRVADDVRIELRRRPGQEVPEEIVALREGGLRWTATVDPFGVAVLDQVSPDRPLGEVVAGVAEELGVDVVSALTSAIPVLTRMVEEGFLRPEV
jgi:methylase of polypeptide subunit release factors